MFFEVRSTHILPPPNAIRNPDFRAFIKRYNFKKKCENVQFRLLEMKSPADPAQHSRPSSADPAQHSHPGQPSRPAQRSARAVAVAVAVA